MSDKKKTSASSGSDGEENGKSPEARILETPDGNPTQPKGGQARKRKADVETVGTIKLSRGTTGAKSVIPIAKKGVDSTETRTITAIPPSRRPPK